MATNRSNRPALAETSLIASPRDFSVALGTTSLSQTFHANMSNSLQTAVEFIQLGEVLHALQNPQVYRPDLYAKEVGNFFTLLERARMESTRRMASSLSGIVIPPDRSGLISQVASLELASRVHPIATRLYEEAAAHSLIETDRDVNPILGSLNDRLKVPLQSYQEAMRADTERCLKAKLYRPAIVSAWNLCYDIVRSWIYNDPTRLADFNSLMVQRTARHKKGSRTVGRYEDFFLESDAFVLEICRDASGALASFGGTTYETLHRLLDDRNAFAHANFNDATPSESKSYVDKVIRAITSPPFN